MDFWDLTKLLFRRWYFALPLLLFSLVAVLWTMSAVKPNYLANSYIQLIPSADVAPGDRTKINAWGPLGISALANAATVTVQDENVLNELVAAGYSDNFTLTVNDANALLSVEVTGNSPEQAAGSATELVKRLESSIRQLQLSRGAPEAELISTFVLNETPNLKESNSNVKRAVVAVAGAGLLMTVAVTIGLDALFRRRSRRRDGLVDTDLEGIASGFEPAPAARAEHRPNKPATAQPKTRSTATRAATTSSQGKLPAVSPAVRSRTDWASGERPASKPPVTVTVDYYGKSPADAESADSADADGMPMPADATIVLPLSHQKSRGPGGEGSQRR